MIDDGLMWYGYGFAGDLGGMDVSRNGPRFYGEAGLSPGQGKTRHREGKSGSVFLGLGQPLL